MENREQEQELNSYLKKIFRILRKRIRLIIIITLSATFIGAIAGAFIPVKQDYKSKISIAVNNTKDNATLLKDQNNIGPVQHDNYDVMIYQNFINTYVQIANSNIVTQAMMDSLKIKNVTLEDLKKKIWIGVSGEIVSINANYKDETKVSAIVNTIAMISMEKAKKFNPQYKFLIIDNPVKSYLPIGSNKIKFIIIAFLIGLIISLGIIFSFEFMDETLKSEEDIRKYLNISVIGLIPRNKKNELKIDEGVVTIPETYKTIRSNIRFSPIYKKTQTILVTSGGLDEGKATISLNLAAAMAQDGHKTILVDCNPRKSKISELTGLLNQNGLSELLSEKCSVEDAINKININNLNVVTAGLENLNITELLASSKMIELIDLLKNQYEYIILNAPSMVTSTDAQILAQFSDGCIFVVSSGESNRHAVSKSLELLTKVNAKLFGVILNKIDPKQMWNL